jgi:hypothetical protein
MKLQYLGFLPLITLFIIGLKSVEKEERKQLIVMILITLLIVGGLFWAVN